MNLMIHEVFEKVAQAPNRKEKIEVLQKYNCLAVRDILKGAFDETIQFLLPSGKPPYREDDAPYGYTRSSLHQQTKKLRYLVKGGPGENLPGPRRERMFIEILESVHPDEARLVLVMKDKKLEGKYKGLTKKLVSEAFPKLIVS